MVRGQKKFVAYYRVSTDKQGERGLGMEAQAACVEAFVRSHDGKILASFREVESGKRNDRPQLDAAIDRSPGAGRDAPDRQARPALPQRRLPHEAAGDGRGFRRLRHA